MKGCPGFILLQIHFSCVLIINWGVTLSFVSIIRFDPHTKDTILTFILRSALRLPPYGKVG